MTHSQYSSHSRSSAFTLVELLVVITIIGILIALLLPAVQVAREAARRMQCRNNLKQIGLALHLYHEALNTFPPGSIMTDWETDKGKGGALVRILPYIEQRALYESIDFSRAIEGQTFPGTTSLIQSTPISTYLCPSDDLKVLYGKALHNYAASKGPTAHSDNPGCSCPAADAWNAYALHPYSDSAGSAGAFVRSLKGICYRGADFRDGLSTTIFFGEVRPACSGHNAKGWATSNNGQGLVSTLVPINYDTCSTTNPDNCRNKGNWNMELGFKSSHSGGAHFLLGDGSVHFLQEAIDHWTYQYLGARADGQVVDNVL